MDDRKLYEDSNITFVLQNQNLTCSSQLLYQPSLQGSKSLCNVVNVSGIGLFDRPMFQDFEKEEKDGDDGDEDYEVCLNQTAKKRRLTNEQVKSLESNFEVENKLGPKRKVQLAKELGLEPRQVAIWFQNRRARFKTKQLEKDYTTLKGCYDVLKVEYDNLLQENDKLKEEVNYLKNRMVPKEKAEQILVDKAYDDVYSQHKIHMDLILNAVPKNDSKVPLPVNVISKLEDANSAKSDVDSESPHNTDGNQSSFLDHSDFSQDEEDILSQNLLTVPFLPKVEDRCYDEPPECSCSFQFPFEDQSFGFWSY